MDEGAHKGARLLSTGAEPVGTGTPTDLPADSNPPTEIRGWVYAIGRIDPQFPDLGVEKEFAQLSGGAAAQPRGVLETDELIEVLRDPDNAYLARQLCWVFSAGEVEAFTLVTQDDAQARRLVDALPSAEQAEQTVQVVIGTMGSPRAEAPCAGSGLPAVRIDHHLAFQVDEFIDALAAEDHEDEEGEGQEPDENFRAAAWDLFARLTRRSNNRGITEEHRALGPGINGFPPLR